MDAIATFLLFSVGLIKGFAAGVFFRLHKYAFILAVFVTGVWLVISPPPDIAAMKASFSVTDFIGIVVGTWCGLYYTKEVMGREYIIGG